MAIKTGTLVNDVKSPYSSPYVHYSCTYSSEREDNASAVRVTLHFKGWLGSSGSYLGTGIVLQVYARLNGGKWENVTMKAGSETWKGNAAKYAAPAMTLSGNCPSGKAAVEFYVTRADNGGNSGKIGTAKSPKKYAASLPAFGGGSGGTTVPVRCWRYNVAGVYKRAQRFEKINGVWVQTVPRVNVNGVWKKGVN